jgi:hypothetical protein
VQVIYTLADVPELRQQLARRHGSRIMINTNVAVEHIVKSRNASRTGFLQVCSLDKSVCLSATSIPLSGDVCALFMSKPESICNAFVQSAFTAAQMGSHVAGFALQAVGELWSFSLTDVSIITRKSGFGKVRQS